ncbi:hypothetical protein G7046_g7800 [Stylonectria norvegica]|nr:hypothetical protein G7046_g7800 [Stylonectria norvegica]
MKLINLSLLFLTAFETALAVISACPPKPSSCALLPTYSAEICSDIIASKSLTLKSCFVPTETETITLTKSATIKATTVITAATTTLTTTSTISKSVTKTIPTIGILYQTQVLSETYTSVIKTTIPKVETKLTPVTVTITKPATKTATTTSTWAQQSCEAPGGGQKLKIRGSRPEPRDALPMNCYCYLTSTSTSALTVSKTIAITQSTTTTITKFIGGKAALVTNTLVIKTTTTVPTTIAAVTHISTTITKTIKTKFTLTSTKTAFSLTTVTSPYTKTATTSKIPVSTVQVNPCGPTDHGRVAIDQPGSQDQMVNSLVTLAGSTNVNKDCCNACYNALGCVYWAVGKSDGTCHNFAAKTSAGCSTSQCPNGFPQFIVSGTDTSFNYFEGPCGTGKTQG